MSSEPRRLIDSTEFPLLSLLSSGRSRERSMLTEVLRQVAANMDAAGCVLWQEIVQSDAPENNTLFIFADSFGSDGLRSIPVGGSETGRAMLAGTPRIVADAQHNNQVYTEDGFLQHWNVRHFCTIPIAHETEEGAEAERGAVNIYRDSDTTFSEDDLARGQELANVISTLLRAFRNDTGVHLIGRINSVLHAVEAQPPRDTLPDDEIAKLLASLCTEIQTTLNCKEVTIFIGDRPQSVADCAIATTWSDGLTLRDQDRLTEALTEHVFATRQPLLVADLAGFDPKRIGVMVDVDPLETIRAEIQKDTGADDIPPRLSFIAVPLTVGEAVYGVLRCRVPRTVPNFFTRSDLQHLTVAAAQIARYWGTRLAKRDMQRELDSWRRFVQSIGALNTFVRRELSSEVPRVERIYEQALDLAGKVMTDAEITDVRLLDPTKSHLSFAVTAGSAWKEGTPEEREARRNKIYPVKGRPPASAGAWVIQSGRVREMRDVHNDPFYDETFANARSMIIAPISLADEPFGVLDIRATGEHGFPPYAADIARLLGRQLGLYSYLARTITQLRGKESELRESIASLLNSEREHAAMFQDLTHQLKTGTAKVVASLSGLLDDYPDLDPEARTLIEAIRGLCRKIERVSYNSDVFTALAQEKPIPMDDSSVSMDSLLDFLNESAREHTLINRSRSISFIVDEKTFPKARIRALTIDLNLVEQAVTNLLDNAGKYSYPNTVVRITGGRTGSDGFQIAVANRGIPIYPEETEQTKKRGWRSDWGITTSRGSGSGIGLWIVDHIMKAHDGILHVEPTTDRWTEVRLLFPAPRVIRRTSG